MPRPFVTERFSLDPVDQMLVLDAKPDFDPLGEFTYYRSWSRAILNEQDEVIGQETFPQSNLRIVESTMAIRKQHYKDHPLPWDEEDQRAYAYEMAMSHARGEWGPPGRGYWASGKQAFLRGGMALNNCGFSEVERLSIDVHWIMDALMLGCGVGFSTWHDVMSGLRSPRRGGTRWVVASVDHDGPFQMDPHTPTYYDALSCWDDAGEILFVVPDSRTGWCDAVSLLLRSYETGGPTVRFDCSLVRKAGTPLKTFGGVASGPAPLKRLLRQLRVILDDVVLDGTMSKVFGQERVWANCALVSDVVNLVGCMVVAGNVRRSATIALGDADDPVFPHLKNYQKYPYRAKWGWMSNNSIVLRKREDFDLLPRITQGILTNGEPGFLNMLAIQKRGRMRDKAGTPLPGGTILRRDPATGINPCGEVPLENKELCCLAEVYPTNCRDADGKLSLDVFLKACEYASFYTQTVQLLPTHRPETNAVVKRNMRTGVSLNGAVMLREYTTLTEAIKWMEAGYAQIREVNTRLSRESKTNPAIRVTAEKPSGTSSKVWGVTPGAHWPWAPYQIRRVRVNQEAKALAVVAAAAGVPFETDTYSQNTDVYSFPLAWRDRSTGATIRPASEVSMWEAADFAATLSDHFVDNATSVTVNFDPITKAEKQASVRRLTRQWANAQAQIGTLVSTGADETEIEAAVTVARQAFAELTKMQQRTPEGDDLERLIASFAGKVKSMSYLPRTQEGAYVQMPEEEISEDEYLARLALISPFDWSSYTGDGENELYCGSAGCEVPAQETAS